MKKMGAPERFCIAPVPESCYNEKRKDKDNLEYPLSRSGEAGKG